MAEVKWIKIVTDIFDDEKILLIESMPDAYAIIVCWFKLLCLAGKQNNNGVFLMNNRIAYTDEMLATIFRMPINSVRMALETFKRFEMIEVVDGVITIPNWNKHQSLDAYEKKKVRDRERIARKRAEQKALIDMSPDKSPDVAVSEEDKEEEKDKKKRKSSVFTQPTIEEVQAYCNERQNGVDAERFVDYYTANGWLVGKNKMKDWKAAVRTWERNNKEVNKNGGSTAREDTTGNIQQGKYGTWL